MMPEAQSNFLRGNEYLAQGALLDAIVSYQKVFEIRPDHGPAHCGASLAYLQLGRFDQAEAHARAALARDTELADAHDLLGLAQNNQGRGQEAECSFRQALKLRPDSAEILSHLGNTLIHRGRFSEAGSHLRCALVLEPALMEALYNLAAAHAHMGRYDSAETFLGRALGVDAQHLGSLMMLGDFLNAKGRFKEAETLYLRALAIRPKDPTAWSALPSLRKMTTDDAGWMATAEEMVEHGLTPNEEISLRFAMGKYCDDVANFDQAFSHFRRANELSKEFAGNRYDPQGRTLLVDRLMQIFARDRLLRVHDGASDSMRPVFIVGMPRSGTTLVEQIIASHPEAFGAGELNFWGNTYKTHEKAILNGDAAGGMLSDVAQGYLQHLIGFNRTAARIVDKILARPLESSD